jgi:hypothetical protein
MTNDEGLQRIEKALAGLGSEHVPREGWEARVLDEIRKPSASREPEASLWRRWLQTADLRMRRRLLVWTSSVLAAAAGLVIFVRLTGPEDFAPSVTYRPGQSQQMRGRGESPHLGDIAEVTVTGGEHRAVWIYHHDQLEFTCPGELRPDGATCSADGDKLTAEMPLALPGDYAILMLADDEPLPEPTGLYDSDHAAAAKAGAEIEPREFDVN